jgi:hypothetical protein
MAGSPWSPFSLYNRLSFPFAGQGVQGQTILRDLAEILTKSGEDTGSQAWRCGSTGQAVLAGTAIVLEPPFLLRILGLRLASV